MRGKFIAIYGINNIGKTTHARRLASRLRRIGRKAVYIKYPIYSQKPTGPLINSVLRQRGKQKISEYELQLWFVLNRYQFQPQLNSMLQNGINIVAEDYTGTGIAWGTAKGCDTAELEKMNKFLVQPDLSIFMDGTRVLTSREKRHIHESDDLLIKKCATVFQKLAKKYKWKRVLVDKDKNVTAMRMLQNIKSMV